MIDRREFLIAGGVTACLAAVPMSPLLAGTKRARVVGLKVDYLERPLGLENLFPCLSWRLESAERNVRQTAYRIRVASTERGLASGGADLWDSGEIASSRSFGIRYGGRALNSREVCWWNVQVWDEEGSPSAPSDHTVWEMGLLKSRDWFAEWLAAETPEGKADRETGLHWMWGEETKNKSTQGFRLRFLLPDKSQGGEFFVVANDWPVWTQITRIWIDGSVVAGPGEWVNDSDRIGITESSNFRIELSRFCAGEHLVAIEVEAAAAPSWGEDVNLEHLQLTHGIAGLMRLNLENGKTIRIKTGPAWKTALVAGEEWASPDFNDSSWAGARPIPLESQPWAASAAMWLRRTFPASKPIARARLYVTALGAYEVRLNGQRVGDALLTPEPSYYAKHVLYRVHDVEHLLKLGQNAIGLTVGDGWYASFDDRYAFGPPPRGVIAQLELSYQDGSREVIGTGPGWRTKSSPILESQIRIGEIYDARAEQPGWDTASFDDTHWAVAEVRDIPSGRLVAQVDPPIRAVQSIAPRAVNQPKPGISVFDFGQNLTGWCRLHVKGRSGTRIELRYAELLDGGGEVAQPYSSIGVQKRDVYILKGDPAGETFEPLFTYRSFRYVQLSGLPSSRTADTLTGISIHTDLEQTGTIRSEATIVEEIWRATARTHDANLIGLAVDTPSREARPYAEVSEIIWDGLSYDRDTAALTQRVMDVFVDNREPTEMFPRRVLTPLYNNAMESTVGTTPGHGEAAIVLPWIAWQRYGDTAIIERYWGAMNGHVQCILDHNPDHIWRTYLGHNEGDWFALDVTELNSGLPHTPKEVVSTAFLAYSLELLAQMANAIQRPADGLRLRKSLASVQSAFDATFVREDGAVANESQTSYILALHFGLVPPPLRSVAAARLVADIRARGTALTTGIFGTQFVLDVLANTGFVEVAYDLLLKVDYPSWGHMLRGGGDTIWETWSGYVEANTPAGTVRNPMGRSHPDLASAAGFLFRHFAGIAPASPGFETISVHPKLDPRIRSGGGEYISVMGRICTDWTQSSSGELSLNVQIPANCRGIVHLPARRQSRIGEGRFDLSGNRNLYSVTRSDSEAVINVPSGTYKFTVQS